MTEPAAEPRVVAGNIVALRLFDIAYAIDLAKAERAWTSHAAGRTARSRLTATPSKAIAFDVPPLELVLEPATLVLATGEVEAGITARLYDFGAVTLALRVTVPSGLPWSGYATLLDRVARSAIGGSELWEQRLDTLRRLLAEALVRPSPSTIVEDYVIGTVHQFDARPKAAELLEQIDLVPLLTGEQRPLSEPARADLLRQRFSYYDDDLVVITWDRAFVYEPRGDSDVADVLEVANAQLLEMRYYDELLDDELPRMYDWVQTARRGLNVLAARRYAGLARRLYTIVAEVTELTERVDNALQVTEDVYLARVYAAALDLFRVRLVSAAVDRKLAIIRDTYSALYDEASSSRAELLEVAILGLILVEIALALLRH